MRAILKNEGTARARGYTSTHASDATDATDAGPVQMALDPGPPAAERLAEHASMERYVQSAAALARELGRELRCRAELSFDGAVQDALSPDGPLLRFARRHCWTLLGHRRAVSEHDKENEDPAVLPDLVEVGFVCTLRRGLDLQIVLEAGPDRGCTKGARAARVGGVCLLRWRAEAAGGELRQRDHAVVLAYDLGERPVVCSPAGGWRLPGPGDLAGLLPDASPSCRDRCFALHACVLDLLL
jgi:hypothetical protein